MIVQPHPFHLGGANAQVARPHALLDELAGVRCSLWGQSGSDALGPDLASREALEHATPHGLDSVFVDIQRAEPAFAGLYLRPDSTLVVLVTDRAAGPRASSLARGYVEHAQSGGAGTPVEIQTVRYSFDRLFALKAALRKLLSDPLAVSVDVDERANVVRLGLAEGADITAWQARVAKQGIPADAVVIEHQELPRFAAKITDKIRPYYGGLKMQAPHPGGNWATCTIGFAATDIIDNFPSYYEGMVTASHCSYTQGFADGGYYGGAQGWAYQPAHDIIFSNVVAAELEDPPCNPSMTGCPAGKACRYSDASFWKTFSLSGEVTQAGKVAKTCSQGSTSICSVYDVIGIYTPAVGAGAYFTGAASGTKLATVSQTCVDTGVSGVNIFLFCQNVVNTSANYADSGAPVFGTTTGVILAGILWGITSNSYYYSPYAQIQADMPWVQYF